MLTRHIRSALTNAPMARGRRAFAFGHWRAWIALFTAVSFALLITTAATHHHATAVDDQDCAVCSVVTHKISGTPLVALTHLVVILLSYAPFLFALPASAPVSFRLLPPSCGPPALAPAIC